MWSRFRSRVRRERFGPVKRYSAGVGPLAQQSNCSARITTRGIYQHSRLPRVFNLRGGYGARERITRERSSACWPIYRTDLKQKTRRFRVFNVVADFTRVRGADRRFLDFGRTLMPRARSVGDRRRQRHFKGDIPMVAACRREVELHSAREATQNSFVRAENTTL